MNPLMEVPGTRLMLPTVAELVFFVLLLLLVAAIIAGIVVLLRRRSASRRSGEDGRGDVQLR